MPIYIYLRSEEWEKIDPEVSSYCSREGCLFLRKHLRYGAYVLILGELKATYLKK